MTSSQFAASQSFASLFRPLYTQTLEVVFLYHMIWLSSGLLVFFYFPLGPQMVPQYTRFVAISTTVVTIRLFLNPRQSTCTQTVLLQQFELVSSHLSGRFTCPGLTCPWFRGSLFRGSLVCGFTCPDFSSTMTFLAEVDA